MKRIATLLAICLSSIVAVSATPPVQTLVSFADVPVGVYNPARTTAGPITITMIGLYSGVEVSEARDIYYEGGHSISPIPPDGAVRFRFSPPVRLADFETCTPDTQVFCTTTTGRIMSLGLAQTDGESNCHGSGIHLQAGSYFSECIAIGGSIERIWASPD